MILVPYQLLGIKSLCVSVKYFVTFVLGTVPISDKEKHATNAFGLSLGIGRKLKIRAGK